MTQIRTLGAGEAAPAARLLARAFAQDPVITHFLADPRRRRWAYPAFFRAALQDALASETVFGAWLDGQLVAVAAWLPPEPRPATRAGRARAASGMALVRLLFPRATPPLLAGFEELTHLHPDETHWYLAFVGVAPEQQGHGIGAELLGVVHEHADAAATPCYLETPFPQTHRFYRGLGYAQVGEAAAFAGAPAVARFLRQPRSLP
jgi:GNAT superfamily N-acetyltransferase